MAVPEERDDVTSSEQKTPGQVPLRTGLSPTVEGMFGALVEGSDQSKEEYFGELEAKRGSRLGSP